MPFVELKASPHASDISPVRIHYRDIGSGTPTFFLHGGWGYGAYPIDQQIEELSARVRFLIPDRSGHGHSSRFPGPLPIDFHHRAAEETLLVLNALGIDRAVLWGHSDGAVIAAKIGLAAPERCERLILEAFHFCRNKPSSKNAFFQKFADHPRGIGEKLRKQLAADHGPDHWENVVQRNCRVWLELAAQSKRLDEGTSANCKFRLRSCTAEAIRGRNREKCNACRNYFPKQTFASSRADATAHTAKRLGVRSATRFFVSC